MTASVVLEIASYAVAAAAAHTAADGADQALVLALDSAAFWTNAMLFGPAAIALLAAGLAMRLSRAFPAWLSWLALVSGALALGGALLAGNADNDGLASAMELLTSLGVVGMWVWMVTVGIRLFRLASSQGPEVEA